MAGQVRSLQDVQDSILSIQTKLVDFGVHSIAVFGSFSHNEMTDKSDVDVLIEFNRSKGFFEFARLKNISR